MNVLDSWGADIENSYLEEFTEEKMIIKAGQEFGPLQGYALIINKASRMLRTSGLRWHKRLNDYLREMGHEQCKMDPDSLNIAGKLMNASLLTLMIC